MCVFVYVQLYTLKRNSQCDSVAKSSGVALNCRNKTHEHGGSVTSGDSESNLYWNSVFVSCVQSSREVLKTESG